MSEVKWIKITTDIFDNRKIKVIEKLPEGDSILVCWFKLLCLAGICNDDGRVYITKEIPYTTEDLATVMGKELNVVKLAIKTFQHYKMIEIVDDHLRLSNWERYQNVDGMERIRQRDREWHRKKRAEMKALKEAEQKGVDGKSNDKSLVVDKQNKKKSIDIEEDIDKEEVVDTSATIEEASPASYLESNNVYKLWEDNMVPITPLIAEDIKDMVEAYGEPLTKEAIKEAARQGVRHSTKYVYNTLMRMAKGERKRDQGKSMTKEDFVNMYKGDGNEDN